MAAQQHISGKGVSASGTNDSAVFVQKVIQQFLATWYWFALSLIVCLSLVTVYLRYATPLYKINATILVQDEKKGADFGDTQVLDELGLGGKSNVDNEVEILKSRTLLESVVRDLQLYVRYFVSGRVKSTELYEHAPYTLRFLTLFPDSIRLPSVYTVQEKEHKRYMLSSAGLQRQGVLGDTILLPEGVAVLSRTYSHAVDSDETYTIHVSNPEAIVRSYRRALTIAVTNKQVSTINITLAEVVCKKGEAIVNKLISNYLQANVDDKNRIADSTMAFIDARLALVSRELTGIEKEIEGFRTSNKLTDISEQAKLLLNNTSLYAREQTASEVQLRVVESLEKLLTSDNTNQIVPSSLVVQEPNFIALVQKYNEVQMLREKLLMSAKEKHPAVQSVDRQLVNLREDLLSSIASIKHGLQISISELARRTGSFQAQMAQVPAKERVFLDFSRQQEIKQELYLFLLKKREETAISKSSTLANARIIDSARADASPFKPQRSLLMLLALVAGVGLPMGLLYLKDMLSMRLQDRSDITQATQAPIIAEIGHNREHTITVVHDRSKGYLSEQFRSLRTNLQFLFTTPQEKVVLLTSSMSGEGKSFVAINLCSTLALANKRVILLELDLRKPKISDYLDLRKEGFTNYAITDVSLQQLIQPSGVTPFDVLSSGPLPPNPAELIMLPKVRAMFDQLRTLYDYIIIDTAPIGLVTDAQLLAAYTDITLYLVRQQYTYKQQLQIVENLFEHRKLPKLNLIVNDIRPFGVGYYGYGYHYGYGEEEKRGFFSRILRRGK